MTTAQQTWPQRWLVLVAAAGYGKTTALETIGGDGPTTCHRATDLIGAASHASPPPLERVAVDEVSALTADDQLALVRLLTALPGQPAVTLAARQPLTAAALSACAVPVVERGPETLALSRDAVARILRDEHAVPDSDLAYLVYELTAGWPAWVHLAGDALGRQGVGRRELLAALTEPGTAGGHFARDEVLADLPAPVARLLGRVHDLDPISAPLCAAVDGHAAEGTAEALRWATRTGLLVAHPRRRPGRTPPTLHLVRVLAEVLAQQPGRPEAAERRRRNAAADWYLANAYPLAAARALHDAGDTARCADLIARHGGEMLAAGGAPDVTDLVNALPQADQSPDIRLIHGEALRMSGSVTQAARVFAAAAAQAAPRPSLAGTVALAGGDGAVPACRLCRRPGRARPGRYTGAGHPARPRRRAGAGLARHTLAQLGQVEDAITTGTWALAVAQQLTEDAPLAAAHIAAALTSSGTRRDGHLAEALAAAERAGDLVQQARVLVNQAHCLLREARYPVGAGHRRAGRPRGGTRRPAGRAGDRPAQRRRGAAAAGALRRGDAALQPVHLGLATVGTAPGGGRVYGFAEVAAVSADGRRRWRPSSRRRSWPATWETCRCSFRRSSAWLGCGARAWAPTSRPPAPPPTRRTVSRRRPALVRACRDGARWRTPGVIWGWPGGGRPKRSGAARAGRQSDALAEALELTAAVRRGAGGESRRVAGGRRDLAGGGRGSGRRADHRPSRTRPRR